jgi:hypothetical protein
MHGAFVSSGRTFGAGRSRPPGPRQGVGTRDTFMARGRSHKVVAHYGAGCAVHIRCWRRRLMWRVVPNILE